MKRVFSILCLALLAGCGGGDDGGGSSSGGGTIFDPGPRDPLPSAWIDLDYYFDVELIQNGLNTPCKMDQAPDGRLFVSLLDGQIITVQTTAPYTVSNWASVTVLNGSEQGLLGIAVSPNFATDHYVYVVACVNNGSGDVQQVIRYEEVGGVGVNPSVIMDNLPTASIHNSGALEFMNDGTLLLTVGDANVPADAQANGTNAGRVLRFNVNGTPAAGNPFTGSDEYEWCRGLRNSYGLCVHPTTGTVMGVENGPANNDELNYLVAGKNYEWGNTGTIPGAQIGVRVRNWPTVIVPTGVTWHSGTDVPAGYGSNLFICSYDEARIYRFVMDGSPPVNISSEHVFGEMSNIGTTNKPLDILEAADGSLYVSTFTAIWRIWRRTGP